MCGINGFFDTEKQMSPEEMGSVVQKMSHTLAHRGPDDSGLWVDAENGIALGHRRLAIIDISIAQAAKRLVTNGSGFSFTCL